MSNTLIAIFILPLVAFGVSLHQKRANPFEIDQDLHEIENIIKERIFEVGKLVFPLPEDAVIDILGHLARAYIPVHAQAEECRNHSKHLLQSFLSGEMWALKMLDAGSKLVPGVLDGHLQDLGNYEQCISVEEPGQAFKGQHCVINTFGLMPNTNRIKGFVDRRTLDFIFSICVPSSCAVDDVASHVDLTLSTLNATTYYTKRKNEFENPIYAQSHLTCSTSQPMSFRFKDYVAICFFSFLIVVVFISTIYEFKSGSKSGLTAFSLKRNWPEFMDSRVSAHEITCMNGMRVISIIGMLFYHRLCFTIGEIPSLREKTLAEEFDKLPMKLIEATTKGVDVFFLLGGTVCAYSFFREQNKGIHFGVVRFYVNRYIRLTPLLAVVMLFTATLAVHMSQGPLWMRVVPVMFEYPCVNTWWSGLLYINNYMYSGFTCVSQAWYLNCDFQLHLLAPLVLFPLYRRPRLGVLLITGCALASVIAAGVNAYSNKFYSSYIYSGLILGGRSTEMLNGLAYKGTHFRAAPFLMGILLGRYIFKAKNHEENLTMSKRVEIIGWTASLGLLIVLTTVCYFLASPHHQWSPWLDPLYVSLAKPLYCASMAWVVYMCAMGRGVLLRLRGLLLQLCYCCPWLPLHRSTI